MRAVPRKQRYRLDFRALMAQCEQNYAWLTTLLGALDGRDELQLAVPGGPGRSEGRLGIRVQERCRYTTVLQLRPESLHSLLPAPRLTVRLYHDARMAEVTGVWPWRSVQARHEYPNPAMHQKDEKYQWNRFLAEWLRYLHDHGMSACGSGEIRRAAGL